MVNDKEEPETSALFLYLWQNVFEQSSAHRLGRIRMKDIFFFFFFLLN